MDDTRRKNGIVKIIIFGLVLGFLLTCGSIVVGRSTPFQYCDFTPDKLHVVDRGVPLAYFKVTPSQSICDPVDNIGAVWASDVGNDVSFKALFADFAIWSGLSIVILLSLQKIIKRKSHTSGGALAE